MFGEHIEMNLQSKILQVADRNVKNLKPSNVAVDGPFWTAVHEDFTFADHTKWDTLESHSIKSSQY